VSLETQITALVAAANSLTGAVNGKINEINAKVAAATDSVPGVVRGLANQTFFIDAIDGNDANAGTSSASPLKTAAAASAKFVSGSQVTLYFKTKQTHAVSFFMPSGRISVNTWGSADIKDPNDRATLKAQLSILDALGNQQLAGPGLASGQMFFTGVNIICDADSAVPMSSDASFVRYTNSHTAVMLYYCDITLGNVPFATMYTGYSARDIYMASVSIKSKAGYEASACVLKNRNSTPPTVRFEAHAVSLTGITGGWPQLLPPKSADNYLGNVTL
jgi:hypothetical protein